MKNSGSTPLFHTSSSVELKIPLVKSSIALLRAGCTAQHRARDQVGCHGSAKCCIDKRSSSHKRTGRALAAAAAAAAAHAMHPCTTTA